MRSAAVNNTLNFVAHPQPSSPVIRLGNDEAWGWWHLHAGWLVLSRTEKSTAFNWIAQSDLMRGRNFFPLNCDLLLLERRFGAPQPPLLLCQMYFPILKAVNLLCVQTHRGPLLCALQSGSGFSFTRGWRRFQKSLTFQGLHQCDHIHPQSEDTRHR